MSCVCCSASFSKNDWLAGGVALEIEAPALGGVSGIRRTALDEASPTWQELVGEFKEAQTQLMDGNGAAMAAFVRMRLNEPWLEAEEDAQEIYGIVTYNDGRKRVVGTCGETDIDAPAFYTTPGTFRKSDDGVYYHRCFDWTFSPYPSQEAAEAALKKSPHDDTIRPLRVKGRCPAR